MLIKMRVKSFRTGMMILLAVTSALSASIANSANIMAFGDSITAGYGSDSGGYPPRLHNLLNSNSKPSVVANFGESGETTPEGVDRLGTALGSFAANMVLIMEGTNDVWRGISVETTRFNLQAMINKTKAAGATPVLSTLTPSDRGGSATLIPQTWNPMIKSLAGSNSIKIADQYSAVVGSWSNLNSDGIHPNDNGYQVLANTWYSTIASMISSTGAVTTGNNATDKSKKLCFIATAAFGSPINQYVTLLKDVRDQWLLPNFLGRQFVKVYNALSPPIAEFIGQHEIAKLAVRLTLYPLILLLYFILKLTFPLQLGITALTSVLFVLSAMVIKNRR